MQYYYQGQICEKKSRPWIPLAFFLLLFIGFGVKSWQVNGLLAAPAAQFEAAAAKCVPVRHGFDNDLDCGGATKAALAARDKVLEEQHCAQFGSRWWLKKINGAGAVQVNVFSVPLCSPWPF